MESNTTQAAALGMFAGMSMMLAVIAVVLGILVVVAHWRMFQKAGEKGWKALIPVYSDYVLFKVVWAAKSFWIYLGAAVATVALNMASGQFAVINGQIVAVSAGNPIVNVLAYVAGVVVFVYSVLVQIKTALAYGKQATFAIGLLLLPSIFTLILGFGKAEYQGPQY